MDTLTSGKQFKSLLDAVEADQAKWPVEELDDVVLERAAMGSPFGAMTPPQSLVLGDKAGGGCNS